MTSPGQPRRTTGMFVGSGAEENPNAALPSAKPTVTSDRAIHARRRGEDRHAPSGDSTTRTVAIAAVVVIGVGIVALLLLLTRAPRPQEPAESTNITAPVPVVENQPVVPVADSVTRPKAPPRTSDGAVTNLIENPTFDLLDNQGRPVGWASQVYGGSCEFTVSRDGRRGTPAVCVRSTTGGDGAWFTKLHVKPHTSYVMKCWIRCDQLTGGGRGAQINLHVSDVPVDGRSDAITGTSGWKQVQFLFESGSLTEVQLNCLFGGWGQSTGTAWFDDVQVIELAAGR